MSERRQVRVAPSFFDRLDELLPEDYEAATLEVRGLPDVRALITAGALTPRLALYVTVAADGAVEIIYLQLDDGAG